MDFDIVSPESFGIAVLIFLCLHLSVTMRVYRHERDIAREEAVLWRKAYRMERAGQPTAVWAIDQICSNDGNES